MKHDESSTSSQLLPEQVVAQVYSTLDDRGYRWLRRIVPRTRRRRRETAHRAVTQALENSRKLPLINSYLFYALFSCICTVIFGQFLKGGENVRKVSYAHLNR